MLSIIAIALSVVALALGAGALVLVYEMREDLYLQKRVQSDLTSALRRRLEEVARTVAAGRGSRSSSDDGLESLDVSDAAEFDAGASDVESASSSVEPEEERFIHFECSTCGQSIEAPAVMSGYHITCPICSALITVPIGSAQAVAGKGETASPFTEEGVDLDEEILKGSTVRMDVGKLAERTEPPKRRVLIRRRG